METPNKWVHYETYRSPDTMDLKMRLGVRGRDGWVKVMDLTTDGWLKTLPPTRRDMLENMRDNIALELAKLTLEET